MVKYRLLITSIAVIAIVTFIPTFSYVMNHIYIHGSSVLDTGWFTFLLANSTELPPANPPVLAGTHLTGTYFSTHFSPFVYLSTLLYQPFKGVISEPAYFSIFIALMYSTISISFFGALYAKTNKIAVNLLLIPTSIIAAFNGVSLGLIGFPHFEIAIPALTLLFFVLYSKDRLFLAIAVFIFMLAIREDAGLHFFLLSFLAVLAITVQTKNIPKYLLYFCVASLCYSLLSIFLQKTFFPGESAISRIYTGDPFYNHLNREFILGEIEYFAKNRSYIWAPWVLSIYLFVKNRNYLYLAGFLSTVPYLFVALFAVSPMASSLANYYAFPFIVSILWPAVAASPKYGSTNSQQKWVIFSVPIVSLMLFLGTIGHVDNKPWEKVNFSYTDSATNVEKAIDILCNNLADMGATKLDDPVSALAIKCIAVDNWLFTYKYTENESDIETIVYFDSESAIMGDSIYIVLRIAKLSGIEQFYSIPGTRMVIATKVWNEKAEKLLGAVRIDFPANTVDFSFVDDTRIWQGCELPSIVGKYTHSCAIESSSQSGRLNYGPYVSLPAGKYQFEMEYSADNSEDSIPGEWDIVILANDTVKELSRGVLSGTRAKRQVLRHEFVVTDRDDHGIVEVRTLVPKNSRLTLFSLKITREL